VVGNQAKIYVGKPLGLVSLHPGRLRQNPGIRLVFQRKLAAAACRGPSIRRPAERRTRLLPWRQRLGMVAPGARWKCCSIMIPKFGVRWLQAMHGLKFGGLLWGTSHMHFRSCD